MNRPVSNSDQLSDSTPPSGIPAAWYRVGLAVCVIGLSIATHVPDQGASYTKNFPWDKVIHVVVFGLVAALAMRARLAGNARSELVNVALGAVLAAFYAYVDELTQDLVGRHTSFEDMIANLVGITGALFVVMRTVSQSDRVMRSTITARTAIVIWLPMVLWLVLSRRVIPSTPLPLPMGPSQVTADGVQLRGDHVLHLVMAMLLLCVLARARPLGAARPRTGNILTLLFVIALAPLIELIQQRVGRGFEWGDLFAHELGVFLACALGGAFLWSQRTAAKGAAAHAKALADTLEQSAGAKGDEAPHVSEPEEPAAQSSSAPYADTSHSKAFVGSAMLVSAFTLASRATGLVRDAALGAVFGLTGIADAFMIGFVVPNLFRRLFGEGALTAAFIPIYTRLNRHDPKVARRLAWLCIAGLLIVVGALTILGELILVGMLAAREWSDDTHLAIRLTMTMLPYAPLVCAVALMGGILQVHRKFGPPAAAPVLLNLVMIGGIALAAQLTRDQGDNRDALSRAVFIVAVSVIGAGVLQLIWLAVVTLRVEAFTRQFDGTRTAVRQMITTMLPMVAGLAVFQVNALLDLLIAFSLSPKQGGPPQLTMLGRTMDYPIADAGATTALVFAQRLYQFPLGVFGIALATAIFPALARAAAEPGDDGRSHFQRILEHGLRLAFFIGLPASAGLILVRLPLTRLIFEYGDMTLADAQRVALILAGYATAVWAYSMVHVLTRAFYAMSDSRTPLVVSFVMVAFNLTLNLTLVWYVGAAGLAWSTAISAMCQAVLLTLALRAYVAQPLGRDVWLGFARTAVATVAMAAALLIAARWMPDEQTSRTASAMRLIGSVVGGALVFAGVAFITRAPELRWLLRRSTE